MLKDMERNLALFRNEITAIDRIRLGLWRYFGNVITANLYCPSLIRVSVLKLFGAQIGRKVLFRSGVKVHDPRKLIIGSYCWIGQDVHFYNHEFITLGNDVCISQQAKICSSSHDIKTAHLQFKHAPIRIGNGAWICLDATIMAGSEIGANSVVSASEIFWGKLPDSHIYKNRTSIRIDYGR